jgi:hypothetical protein
MTGRDFETLKEFISTLWVIVPNWDNKKIPT